MSEETVHNHDGFKGHGYVDGCPRCDWLKTDATTERVWITREKFRHAFGQAFCSEENKHKEMDSVLGIEIERILFGTAN